MILEFFATRSNVVEELIANFLVQIYKCYVWFNFPNQPIKFELPHLFVKKYFHKIPTSR